MAESFEHDVNRGVVLRWGRRAWGGGGGVSMI